MLEGETVADTSKVESVPGLDATRDDCFGLTVEALSFRVWVVGLRVLGSGFGYREKGGRFRVSGSDFWSWI